jgi:AcrR family transcriptional regulator
MSRDTCPVATARPLRRDAELNRQKIIAAAKVVFSERGLEATLDDIAHYAGLGVGTVYRRFPSKVHLVEALFVEQLDLINDLAEKALAEPDAWEGFVGFAWETAELHASDRGLREVMLSTTFGQDKVALSRDKIIPACTKLVERAQASGQLRADLEPTDLPLLHLMVGSVADYGHSVQPGLWRRYLGMLLDGLRAQPGKPSQLKSAPLDVETLDDAMCSWRPPRH